MNRYRTWHLVYWTKQTDAAEVEVSACMHCYKFSTFMSIWMKRKNEWRNRNKDTVDTFLTKWTQCTKRRLDYNGLTHVPLTKDLPSPYSLLTISVCSQQNIYTATITKLMAATFKSLADTTACRQLLLRTIFVHQHSDGITKSLLEITPTSVSNIAIHRYRHHSNFTINMQWQKYTPRCSSTRQLNVLLRRRQTTSCTWTLYTAAMSNAADSQSQLPATSHLKTIVTR